MPKKRPKCNVCAEEIASGALKCKHCGSFQDWRRHAQTNSFIFTILNVFLAILMLMIARSTLKLQDQIDNRQREMLNAKRFEITQQIRNDITEYIDQAAKYLAHETNRILLINPQKADEQTEYFAVYSNAVRANLEATCVLGYDFIMGLDTKGDSIAAYLIRAVPFNIKATGILSQKEHMDFSLLHQDLTQCISEIKYVVQRLIGSHKGTTRIMSRYNAKQGLRDVQKYDLRKNEKHLYWIN